VSIIRHDDGSLTVPVAPGRHDEDAAGEPITEAGSKVIRPGEGGYVEALAEWESEQHPDRGEAVSTASGREQAMAVVHAVAEDPDHVAEAVDALDDPAAGAEALRHVLVGGTPSVQAFAGRSPKPRAAIRCPPTPPPASSARCSPRSTTELTGLAKAHSRTARSCMVSGMSDDDDHLTRARSLRSVADAAALYRDWAADYDADVFERSGVIGSDRIADLLAGALPEPSVRVVDLGCGTGAVGVRLAEHGIRRIVGYDLSPEMLQIAAEKRVYEGLVVADLNDPTIPECELGRRSAPGVRRHVHPRPRRRRCGAAPAPLLAPGSAIAWVVASPLWTDVPRRARTRLGHHPVGRPRADPSRRRRPRAHGAGPSPLS
jgi:hypothetical protein